jgi:thiamine-phosphate pyrophosphorylase
MNIAVIAPLGHVPGEHENVIRLLEAGLPYYHLRKPGLNVADMQAWVQKIPAEYRRRITLHAPLTTALELGVGGVHFRESDRAGFSQEDLDAIIDRAETEGLRVSASVHSPEGALSISDKMLYVFLSQAFNSASKPDLTGSIQNWNLPHQRPCKIYALGGVTADNIAKVAEYGLDGVAVLGEVWHGKQDPLSNFTRIREACQQIVQPS